jgi:hypothetical protein
MHEEYNADGLRVHCAHFTYTRTQKNFESQSFAIKAKAIKVDIPNVNVYMIFDNHKQIYQMSWCYCERWHEQCH